MKIKLLYAFILSITVLFASCNFENAYFINFLKQYQDAKICYYVSYSPNTIPTNFTFIANGSGGIISCDLDKFKTTSITNFDYDGLSITFNGDVNDFNNLVDNLKITIIKKENVENIAIIYGLSNYFCMYTCINNIYINVEIAFNKGIITIGSPIILGSY